MAKAPKLEPFTFSPDDPLADEHAAVAAFVDKAVDSLGYATDLKLVPSGQDLLHAKPEKSRRYVLAAVTQARYWDELAEQVRAQAENEMQRMNAHHLPGWNDVWHHRRLTEAVISSLMRRALPFEKVDLIALMQWCRGDNLGCYSFPLGHIARALKRYAAESPVDDELRAAMSQLAARLRSCYDKEAKRLATTVEQLCVDASAEESAEDAPAGKAEPAPTPAPAGWDGVLDQLKRFVGMLPDDPAPASMLIDPDQFALRTDSPLKQEHGLLSSLFDEVVGTTDYYKPTLTNYAAGRALLALEPPAMGNALLAAAERHVNTLLSPDADFRNPRAWQSRYAAAGVVRTLHVPRTSAPQYIRWSSG